MPINSKPEHLKMASNYFSKIFSHSPFTAMQEHMEIVDQCVHQLTPFFRAVLKQDHNKAKEIYKEIRKLENKADALKKKLRLQMPKGLFMPVARRDLLELLLVQDKIANRTKDVSGLVVGRRLQIPDQIAEQFLEYLTVLEKLDVDSVGDFLEMPSMLIEIKIAKIEGVVDAPRPVTDPD